MTISPTLLLIIVIVPLTLLFLLGTPRQRKWLLAVGLILAVPVGIAVFRVSRIDFPKGQMS
ncbi:MAG: hypothetical protein KDA89_23200, partial [Planctomycetaceae bacterium]|nr:hypothetical protein [Planctomycetaceae bacterium]